MWRMSTSARLDSAKMAASLAEHKSVTLEYPKSQIFNNGRVPSEPSLSKRIFSSLRSLLLMPCKALYASVRYHFDVNLMSGEREWSSQEIDARSSVSSARGFC